MGVSSALPTPQQAIRLLKSAGCDVRLIRHCLAVSNLAVKISQKFLKRNVDVELVRIGALLHDIGRSQTHEITHAYMGSDLLRDSGLPDNVIKIVERHIGAGIPSNEAVNLGLPEKDFIPQTIEEKIVAYADKLVVGNLRISFAEACTQFTDVLGHTHPAVSRFQTLHSELTGNEDPN